LLGTVFASSGVSADGFVNEVQFPSGPTVSDTYVDQPSVSLGFGPINLTAAGAASLPSGSVSSGATLTASFSVTPETFSLTGSAAATAEATGVVQTTANETLANGKASSALSFSFTLTDRSYRYQLGALLLATAGTPVGQTPKGRADVGLFGSGVEVRRIEDTVNPVVPIGSLTGILTPGSYNVQFFADAFARAGGPFHPVHTEADATISFSLLLDAVGTLRWNQPADGVFQTGGNWSNGAPPSGTDNAVIDVPGSYTITLQGNAAHNRLRANGAGVNVTIDANDFDYVLDEISVGGLDGDNVSITFDDSSDVVVSVASAFAGDGLAPAAASSNPAARLRARLLKAGKGSTANVKIPIETTLGTIDFGGRVNVKGANGRWDVVLLTVGDEDVGRLEISAGGMVFSDRAVLGEKSLPLIVGEATVTGQDSLWVNQTLVVGERSTGRLTIADKGSVTGVDIVIGSLAGSVGRITLQDSAELLENSTDQLTVGSFGFGTLEVKSNSRVEAGSLRIGNTSSANGTVTVESLGHIRVSNLLDIGGAGTGTLTVDGGSVLRSGVNFTTISTKGTLTILDGLFHERSKLVVNGTLIVTGVTSSAFVGQSPDIRPGTVTVGPGGTIAGNGLIGGTLRVLPGGVDEFGGSVFSGNSPGTLTVDGDYEQLGGLLGIEIAGTAPGQFDVLAVTGNATLGGTLLLEFIDGFAPRQGDVFNFLDIDGGLTGAFDTVGIRNLAPGFQFDLRTDASGLTMVALNDGVSVPEPATLAMLFAGIVVMCARRRAAVS